MTGTVLYGLVAPGQRAPQPPLPVEGFRVPAPTDDRDLEGYRVLDQIKAAIESGGHKLVNLSLGPEVAVEDHLEPNRWTSELDQLAWENEPCRCNISLVAASLNDQASVDASGGRCPGRSRYNVKTPSRIAPTCNGNAKTVSTPTISAPCPNPDHRAIAVALTCGSRTGR
ncbi:hypothetical protein [Allobranchiibius huperziae]|uniref:Uncharacterized protein n=1 Tax=Allobranchiibius huperziae TaxID=1874116 RepID=A0A853DHH2_9MICO|nr:hypothetical protein [Allobranchiibius huperziae]NYJ74281.1 hypothetical protein [Allobranchiibius huperziae]